jgi:hypothetical protein
MGTLLKKLIVKAAEKASKVDASDAITQLNADDAVTIIKAIFF